MTVAGVDGRAAQALSPMRTTWLLLLAIASTAGVFGTYILFVRTTWGQEIDDAALAGSAAAPQDLARGTWTLIDTISVTSLAIITVVLVLVALIQGAPRLAGLTAVVIAGSVLSTELLKRVIFERPALDSGPDATTLNSLPSGHTTVAMSVSLGAVLVSTPRLRPFVAVVGLAYSAGVGIGVVASGWHRPSDVIAASFVVAAWASAAALVLLVTGNTTEESPGLHGVGGLVAIVVVGAAAVLLAVSFVGLGAVVSWLRDGSLSTGEEAVAYGFASVGILATMTLLFAGLLGGIWGLRLDRATTLSGG